MTRLILLLAIFTATISSCTTAYKTGQTPDDVYFSPARPQDEYVRVDQEDEYRYNDEYYDDRYLRMKVRNRSRWDDLNDWYYYDRYSYMYNYYYGTWYNPYNSWHYYHNPYCHTGYNYIILNPKYPQTHTTITRPRSFSLNSYTNNNISNTNTGDIKLNRTGITSRPVFNNSNTRKTSSTAGSVIRKIFTPGSIENSNDNSSSGSRSTNRTYTPSSSTSNSSSGSSNSSSSGSSNKSSSGSVTRPSRGGN